MVDGVWGVVLIVGPLLMLGIMIYAYIEKSKAGRTGTEHTPDGERFTEEGADVNAVHGSKLESAESRREDPNS